MQVKTVILEDITEMILLSQPVVFMCNIDMQFEILKLILKKRKRFQEENPPTR